MLTDTHCHLDFPDFDTDRAAVLQRSLDAGVHRLITIGTTPASSAAALALARQHPAVRATAGIHPCHAAECTPDDVRALGPLLDDPRTAALGECGLDYHHLPPRHEGESDAAYAARLVPWKEHQKDLFRAQLECAAQRRLNAVIHQRDSWDDTVEILRPFTGRLRAVFHCFGEAPARLQQVLDLGHCVSFTGIVTFKNADAVRASVAAVPGDRFFLETDAPYLAPVPHRGKRCEPAHTALTAAAVARIRGIPLETLAGITETNAERFFRWH